jgi:Flp pilus assembly protein TadG
MLDWHAPAKRAGWPGRACRQRGQALVEFALGALLLFLIVFGVVDFGRVIYAYSAVSNAAREGARYGAVHPSDLGGIQAIAQDKAVGVSIAVTPIVVDADKVTVSVSSSFTPITPLLSSITGTITLHSTATQFREIN